MATKLLNRYNIKLYPIYKMFSWDLLFYYAIIYLFLTLEKGLSASLVLLVTAICQLSKSIFQLLCVSIVDLLKSRKGLILANICCTISTILLIISEDLTMIIISNIIFAFSYTMRQLCESTILYETIPEHKSRNKLFSKIDGIGQSHFYYIDSISAILAGFLFIVNHYIPLILCLIFNCISTGIACKFKNPLEKQASESILKRRKNFSKYIEERKNILKFILHSKRLKCLLIYSGIFTGILTLFIDLRSIVLTEFNFKSEYFGIAIALIQMISAISSKKTNVIQHWLRNKTLTVFAFVNVIPLIMIGIGLACNLSYSINITMVCIWLILYAITKGPFYTLIKRYLQSFSTSSVTTKVYGLDTMLTSTCATLLSLFSSFLLNYISVAGTLIILGSTLSVIFLILLDYMRNYVGLKPEEYKKSQITYVELK